MNIFIKFEKKVTCLLSMDEKLSFETIIQTKNNRHKMSKDMMKYVKKNPKKLLVLSTTDTKIITRRGT